jgi:hypothetical protein
MRAELMTILVSQVEKLDDPRNSLMLTNALIMEF